MTKTMAGSIIVFSLNLCDSKKSMKLLNSSIITRNVKMSVTTVLKDCPIGWLIKNIFIPRRVLISPIDKTSIIKLFLCIIRIIKIDYKKGYNDYRVRIILSLHYLQYQQKLLLFLFSKACLYTKLFYL